MRKLLSLLLLLSLVTSLLSLPGPVLAQTAAPSLAAFFPGNTLVYAELRTADLKATIARFAGLLSKAGVQLPADLFQNVNSGLSTALGRPATFDKDVAGWLGDRAAYGLVLPGEFMSLAISGRFESALALAPKAYNQLWYADLTKFDLYFSQAAPGGILADKTLLGLLKQFKIAALYVTNLGKGDSLSSLSLLYR